MSFDQVWLELEAQSAPPGVLQRRVRPEAACDIYLGVLVPDRRRLLLVDVGDVDLADIDLPAGQGVTVRRVAVGEHRGVVEVALTHRDYADLFTSLAEDLVDAVAAAPTVRTGAGALISRLLRWQAFLRIGRDGLGGEAQRGLFGELSLLLELLVPAGHRRAVSSWTGPSGTAQDFRFGAIAVEVKTTAGKQHQRMQIASELQLDRTGLEHLFLSHLSVDERPGAGKTLPELIFELRANLAADPVAGVHFEDTLITAGYHDLHSARYGVGYTVRDRQVFLVGDGFPAITEHQLPSGVGDVRYSVAVASCTNWLTDASSLYEAVAQ